MRTVMHINILFWLNILFCFLCIFFGRGSRYLWIQWGHYQTCITEVLGEGKCSNEWQESVLIWKRRQKVTAVVAQDRENVHQTWWGKPPGQRPTLSQFHWAQLSSKTLHVTAVHDRPTHKALVEQGIWIMHFIPLERPQPEWVGAAAIITEIQTHSLSPN